MNTNQFDPELRFMGCKTFRRRPHLGGLAVVGPAGSVKDALALINSNTIDAAVLDTSLCGETVIPVRKMLSARDIPFVFATGYDAADLPHKWRSIPRYEKPADAVVLSQALRTTMVR